MTSVIPPLSTPGRCTRETSSSNPRTIFLRISDIKNQTIRPHLCLRSI
nr:unnamed protein product [Callosobruchus chinensis]